MKKPIKKKSPAPVKTVRAAIKKKPAAKKPEVITPTGRIDPPGPEMQNVTPKTPEAKAIKEALKPDASSPAIRPGDVFEIKSFDDIAGHFLARAEQTKGDVAAAWREASAFMKRVRYKVPTMLPDGTHFDPSTVPRPPAQPIVAKEIAPTAPEPLKPAFVIPPKAAPTPAAPRTQASVSDDPKKQAKRERARLRRLKRQKGGK